MKILTRLALHERIDLLDSVILALNSTIRCDNIHTERLGSCFFNPGSLVAVMSHLYPAPVPPFVLLHTGLLGVSLLMLDTSVFCSIVASLKSTVMKTYLVLRIGDEIHRERCQMME